MSQRTFSKAVQVQIRHMVKDARGGSQTPPVKTINRAPPPRPAAKTPTSSTTTTTTTSGGTAKAEPQTPIRSIKIEQASKPTIRPSKAGALKVPVQGQTPPPVPPSTNWSVGRVLGFGTFATATIAAGTLAYAARDDEFREMLEEKVPATTQLLEFLHDQREATTKGAPAVDAQAPLGNVKTTPISTPTQPTEPEAPSPPVIDVSEATPAAQEAESDQPAPALDSADAAAAGPNELESIAVPEATMPDASATDTNGEAPAAEVADEADVEPGLPLEMSDKNVVHMDAEQIEADETALADRQAAEDAVQADILAKHTPTTEPAISLPVPSQDDMKAELQGARQDAEPIDMSSVETLEQAAQRIKVLEEQLDTQASSEAERMHTRLSQQAQQHEAYFTAQLEQAQQEHKATLSQVISDLRQSLDEQFQAREDELRREKQLEIQQHVQVQADKHQQELVERLNAQAAEIWELSENSLRVKLGEERARRMKKMEQMFLQLKAVEAVMERYQERETLMTRMQSLLLATDVLKTSFEDRQALVSELQHLKHLGEKDPFINAVVDALPPVTLRTGAPSEQQLLRSFARMKASARRVAHVSEHGGFWSYVTSYVISFASFEPRGLVAGDDVDSVLARADYYIAQSNLDLAAREVNQLRGQARQVAHDWLVEARQHLEVTQALKTIQGYLSNVAVGLLQAGDNSKA
eukprot:TRINITY_DN12005_c0_g1_i1.p1 TRINITY_DN12005_c0_g1~~TRINITY_DN12005_c0_g1_i1.p1  ORF type:complete len:697 (+),score=197.10 TRINITY_DN12005_c0_g1_i1:108-2198(+)